MAKDFEIKTAFPKGLQSFSNSTLERTFCESVSDSFFGIKVNITPINNIRYADETVILADDDHTSDLGW